MPPSERGGFARADAELIAKAISEAMDGYHCQMTEDVGNGEGLPLLDKLSAPGDTTIESGQGELEYLKDTVTAHVLDAVCPVFAKEVQAARERALEEAAKIVEDGDKYDINVEDVVEEIRSLKSKGGEASRK